ncbi:hypothetical protein NMY22_g15245 [Coprinellus aureogranulatus]|nr:hypothetical protein NMY22_g15245 [Coprinellus aureogranulatus]
MNHFSSDFEASSSNGFSAPTGPLVLGRHGGDVSMGRDDDEDEGAVQWQSSQTTSTLASLLKTGTGRGKGTRPKWGVNSVQTYSDDCLDLTASISKSADSSFSFDLTSNASTSDATASFSSTGSRNVPPRPRLSALTPSARRNVSASTTSLSSPKLPPSSDATATSPFDFIAAFPTIVKQATSQVDENLKHKSTTLSRTSSAGRLCLGESPLSKGPESYRRPARQVSEEGGGTAQWR